MINNQKSKPYSREIYLRYRQRIKKTYTVCAFMTCPNKIERFVGRNVPKKFCCQEHADMYRKNRIKLWHKMNRDKMRVNYQKWIDVNVPKIPKFSSGDVVKHILGKKFIIKDILPEEIIDNKGVKHTRFIDKYICLEKDLKEIIIEEKFLSRSGVDFKYLKAFKKDEIDQYKIKKLQKIRRARVQV